MIGEKSSTNHQIPQLTTRGTKLGRPIGRFNFSDWWVFCVSTGKQAWWPKQCADNSPFMIYAIAFARVSVSDGL
jgi:hypothetical protein